MPIRATGIRGELWPCFAPARIIGSWNGVCATSRVCPSCSQSNAENRISCPAKSSETRRQPENLPRNEKHQDYSVRRLPGPAISPLCEGDQTPEAHHELFRDWQRTQTQSSATALRSPRLQIDVWFCSRAGTIGREATVAKRHILIRSTRALLSAPRTPVLFP